MTSKGWHPEGNVVVQWNGRPRGVRMTMREAMALMKANGLRRSNYLVRHCKAKHRRIVTSWVGYAAGSDTRDRQPIYALISYEPDYVVVAETAQDNAA